MRLHVLLPSLSMLASAAPMIAPTTHTANAGLNLDSIPIKQRTTNPGGPDVNSEIPSVALIMRDVDPAAEYTVDVNAEIPDAAAIMKRDEPAAEYTVDVSAEIPDAAAIMKRDEVPVNVDAEIPSVAAIMKSRGAKPAMANVDVDSEIPSAALIM